MRPHASVMFLIVGMLFMASEAYGQKATERYIPVGKSPGISGKYTYIGQIERVDPENRTIVVTGPEGNRTITVIDATKIWLDRTQGKLSNQRGGMGDLQPGRRVEVNYVNYEKKEQADWIKVVIPDG